MIVKPIATALLATATMLGTGAAHAGGHVSWSIGISAPLVGAVIGNAPYYAPAPVYVPAPPVYVAPRPVYVAPAPVYYPPVRDYRADPVIYTYPRWQREWREDRHHHDYRRDDHRRDDHRH
jgi:hypothetical protein